MIEELGIEDLDRSFLNLSSQLATVFSWSYGMLGYRLVAPLDPNKFDNATSRTKEIGIRTLIVLGAVMSLFFAGTFIVFTAAILGIGSKVCRKLGVYFQRNGFTHIRGEAPEITLKNQQASVMTWNIRGHGGGLYDRGGVVHWRSRIERIVDSIKAEDPDVIVLQEAYDTALMEALAQKLGDRYAHFYTHLGPNQSGDESGCMIITKCAVYHFTNTEFTSKDPAVNRGFGMLEIKASPRDKLPCARIIGTQLTPDKGAAGTRMDQIAQIVNALADQNLRVPTLFVGSFHVDRGSQLEGKMLSKYLYHSYLGDEPTHSDALVSQWAPIYDGQEESSDFISFFRRQLPDGRVLPVIEKDIRLEDSHLVDGFDRDPMTKIPNTQTAASDHNAIVTRFSWSRRRYL